MDPSALYGIRWVHVFEADTPDRAVYRPDSGPIPLSRRPREAFTLHPDGTATLEVGGPDDRPVPRAGRWTATEDGIRLTSTRARGTRAIELQILEASPDRVMVARPRQEE